MDAEEAHVEQANRRIGSVLCGKYTVERILGIGGMAVVYAATHRNQKQVAIKMLHPELSTHAEIRKRFLREGYVANSVKHRGAVDVIDDDIDTDGAAFIVMEYLDGLPVDAIADRRGGRLELAGALCIVHELCGVLAAAHAREIVHRDIKPANVFVTKDGQLKVLDFGIARLRDSSSAHATGTGMTLGTPAFMAPEQARGQTAEVSAASDIWAAGVTLFYLLSGAYVHDADNSQMMMIKVATTPPRSLASVMPSLSADVVEIVDKALKFDKAERWESASAMRQALRTAYEKQFGPLAVDKVLAPLAGGKPGDASVPPATPSKSDVGSASTIMEATPAPARGIGSATKPMSERPTPAAKIGETTAFPVTASFVGPIASKRSLIAGSAVALALVGAVAFVGMRGKEGPPPVTGSALVPATTAPTDAPSATGAPSAAPASTTVLQPLQPSGQPSVVVPARTSAKAVVALPVVAAPPASTSSTPTTKPPPAASSAATTTPTAHPIDPGAVR